MLRAIIFDIGRTLIQYGTPFNWSKLYRPAFEQIAKSCGYSFTEAQYQQAGAVLSMYNTRINPREREVTSDQIFTEIVNGMNLPIRDLEQIKRGFFSYFKQEVSPYPETEQTLKQLRAKGIVLGTLSDVAYGMDNELALGDIEPFLKYIDYPFTSNDVGYRKPSPKGLQILSEKMKIAGSEMAFVGDEEKDIQCAKRAGVFAVLINRENMAAEYGQDQTIHDLTELIALI